MTNQPLVSDRKDLSLGIMNFGEGVRNKSHRQDGDQGLTIIAGKGIVATEEGKRVVTVGEIVLFPAGEEHWHVATKDSDFSQMVVTRAGVKMTHQRIRRSEVVDVIEQEALAKLLVEEGAGLNLHVSCEQGRHPQLA